LGFFLFPDEESGAAAGQQEEHDQQDPEEGVALFGLGADGQAAVHGE
jgi:hypothetical protein